jgi:hypothetical protein
MKDYREFHALPALSILQKKSIPPLSREEKKKKIFDCDCAFITINHLSC